MYAVLYRFVWAIKEQSVFGRMARLCLKSRRSEKMAVKGPCRGYDRIKSRSSDLESFHGLALTMQGADPGLVSSHIVVQADQPLTVVFF